MLSEAEAFMEQKGRPDFNQNFALLSFLNYLENDDGTNTEYEVDFAVPSKWVCDYLSLTEEEYRKWYKEESCSADNEDIFWEALDNNLVAIYSDNVTGYLV